MNDPQAYAKELVERYVQDTLDKTDFVGVAGKPVFDVYVVWFCFILGGWKALVSTSLFDGKYYEVTYNREKHETYLDCYVKVNNVCYPD